MFLGPAVPVEEFLKAVRREKADMVGVSYRLTAETGERVLVHYTQARIAAETHEVYRQLLNRTE